MRWKSDDVRYAAFVGASVLAFLVLIGIVFPAPLPIIVLGLIIGSVSGLTAAGLVLVYRANRIVNFAQGSLGGLAAILAASLLAGPHIPFFVSVVIGLAAALLIGAATEVVFIRRFSKAPRLVLTVATIGVAQFLDFATLGVPKLFGLDSLPQPDPFPFTLNWFPVVFRGGHVLVLLVTPVAVAGLITFLRRSRAGVAIRASAESADRAALLGIPTKQLNTLVWVLASGLSGVAGLLKLPIEGVGIGAVTGVSTILPALAAAVIGKMESLPRTIAAALALGVVEQAVFFRTGKTVVADAVIFVVIIIALLVNGRGSEDRASEREASSWAAVGLVRPVPQVMRRLPELAGAKVAMAALGVLVVFVLPTTWSPARVSLWGGGVVFAILVCSLVVLTGWTGQISLGQVAIAAIGGAVAGTMAQDGKNFFLVLAVAGLTGVLISVVLGVPALRIRGPFLAVTTLAFAQVTGSFVINEQYFAWLVPDREKVIPRPVLFDKFDLASEHAMYYTIVLALLFFIAVIWRLRSSRTGRTLLAVRDNTRAAQSYGISPIRAQLTAFAISGWMAATAGALFVYQQQGFTSSLLQAESSLRLFAVGVIGGLASVPGAILGAAYLTFVDYSSFTRLEISRLFASSLGVLAILLFLPGGLGGTLFSLRDRALKAIAKRRGLHVPSLLADSLDEAIAASPDAAVVLDGDDSRDRIVDIRGVELAYGKAQVLFGVDFHVDRGEILALLGTNGAGKSTILSALCGLAKTQAGSLWFDGQDVTGISPQAALAAGIVLVPGGKAVFPTLTVEEHLRLAAWTLEKTDPAHVAAARERTLETFPRLRERLDQRAGNLSGGEQQMLALGMALIARPKLLCIDELSLGLAPVIVEQLLGIVREIHAAGTTIVLVEQSVNVAASLASRAVFLEKGTVRFSGPIGELLERGDILRAVFLGNEDAPLEDSVGDVAAVESGAHPTAPARTKERIAFEPVCNHCGHEHHVALRVEELAVRFGGIRAVDGVSFEVRQGEVFGLIGPNGAGKTTILDLISGFLEPTEGRVFIDGADVTLLTPDARSCLGLGRSFQDARLFGTLTVRETIATALERHISVRDALAAVVLSPAVKISEREIDQRVEELIEEMSLQAFADKFVGELSTGSRRIVDLACVLAHKPSVLLLDEPASGIAQREAEALGPVLLGIRDRTGAAIVVIEHDIPLISAVSDELIALEAGTPIARGIPSEVLSNPRVVAGYLGGSEVAIQRSGAGAPAAPARRQRVPLKANRLENGQ